MRLPKLQGGGRGALFGLLLLNGVSQGLLAILSAWWVMSVFNDLAGAAESGRSPVVLAALVATVIASALLRRVERIQAEELGQRYVRSVRSRIYNRLLGSNSRAFRKAARGAVLLKFVGDLSALRRWISLGLSRLMVAGVAVCIALAALVYVHWPFALGVTAIVALSAAWILWHSRVVRTAIGDARRCQANLASNITDKLQNLVTVQAFGEIDRERQLLKRQSDRLLRASVDKAAKVGTLRAVIDATAGASVFVVLVLAYLAPPADMTLGMVAAVISIIGFLTPPLRDLGRVQEYWLAAQVARDNVRTLCDNTPQVKSRRSGAALAVECGEIVFDKVSVRGALRRLSVAAEGGSRVAVVGGNGSGKSTLLGLAGRLFDPDRGRVLIDGQQLSRVRLSTVRRQIAYVSAEIPLLRGSLRRNLCYGCRRVDPDQLAQVIDRCRLNDIIDQLPGGLDGRITEGGSNLSQGERMRVLLARALLRRPAVLLLDEADANLDARAIRVLDEAIEKFNGTVLMVTHRESALRLCDAQWVIDRGQLASARRRHRDTGTDRREPEGFCAVSS